MPNTEIERLNPMRSEPAIRYDRSVDNNPPGGGPGGGGGSFDGDWPLKLVAVDTENVKVVFGTVNGFTPSGVETNIDVSGTDATWAIYMSVVLSGTAVISAGVGNDDTGTVPADDATNSYRLIGEVDVSGGVITGIRAAMAWSQEVVICTEGEPSSYHWVVS